MPHTRAQPTCTRYILHVGAHGRDRLCDWLCMRNCFSHSGTRLSGALCGHARLILGFSIRPHLPQRVEVAKPHRAACVVVRASVWGLLHCDVSGGRAVWQGAVWARCVARCRVGALQKAGAWQVCVAEFVIAGFRLRGASFVDAQQDSADGACGGVQLLALMRSRHDQNGCVTVSQSHHLRW